LTISAPPLRVRSAIASMRSFLTSVGSDTPLTVQNCGSGTIESPCAPSTIASTSCTDAAGLLGDEPREARAVEHARHADHALAGEPGLDAHQVHHRVERVGDDDHERLGRVVAHVLRHRRDDLAVGLEQVRAAHARLARQAGGDDEDVRAARVLGMPVPTTRAPKPSTAAIWLRSSAMPLRASFEDVDDDDLGGELLLRAQLRARHADVAGAYDRDLALRDGHQLFTDTVSSARTIACPIARVPTAVGSLRSSLRS
jgi:hypothetical protein